MNGISLLVSKCCCPMYNPGTSNKINLIPFPYRLSNVHLQRSSPSVATTRMLKHGVCSSSKSISKDVTGWTSGDDTDDADDDVLTVLIGGMICIALLQREVIVQFFSTRGGIEGVLKSNARYSFYIGFATEVVARQILGKIVHRFGKIVDRSSVKDSPPFSVGDIIQVGSVEGRVLEIRPTSTVLLGAEKGRLIIPNYLLSSQIITNRTCARWYDIMASKIGFDIDEADKTRDISKEIRNMMVFNPYVLLDVEQPDCHLTGVFEFSLRCCLKHMDPDIYFTAKEDILQQAVEIIKKHGGTSVNCFYSSE